MNNKIKHTGFCVDVEADGPVPGLFSMTEVGIVVLDRSLSTNFYAKLYPMTFHSNSGALHSIGQERKDLFSEGNNSRFPKDPAIVMQWVSDFVKKHTKLGTYPQFLSDNNGFDWSFVNYYFHACGIENPFGYTSRNISDIFRGLNKNMNANFRKLRDQKHTHLPHEDALGNAQALIKFVDRYGLEGLVL